MKRIVFELRTISCLILCMLIGYGTASAFDLLAYAPEFGSRIKAYCFSCTTTNSQDIRQAMVKIYTARTAPDMRSPTNKTNGSGSIIQGNIILTNAHVVAGQKYIQVRKFGESRKHPAQLIYISHESDLAILTVVDDGFYKGSRPLQLGALPNMEQEVNIYGFPGTESLTVSKGVFSKFEHQYYKYSNNYFLAGLIHASIKPGNSGGPVIMNNKIVGVVMQVSRNEDIALMVPGQLIRHFLSDVEDGLYDGFPDIGLKTYKLDSAYMKRKHGLSADKTGVLINHVLPGSPADTVLKKGDILLAINGNTIGDDALVEFRPNERTYYTYFIEMQQLGDAVNVKILRNGKIRNFTILLNKSKKDFTRYSFYRY